MLRAGHIVLDAKYLLNELIMLLSVHSPKNHEMLVPWRCRASCLSFSSEYISSKTLNSSICLASLKLFTVTLKGNHSQDSKYPMA